MPTVLCVGHAVQDFVFTVPELPQHAQKYRATRFESVGGGPAATAAVAVARLGGRVMLAARVGEDAAADMIIAELQAYDVDCTLVRHCPGCASSVSAVLVDARGERMIVNHLDAALPADPEWLPAPWVTGADVVRVDSLHLRQIALGDRAQAPHPLAHSAARGKAWLSGSQRPSAAISPATAWRTVARPPCALSSVSSM